jgi:puromycin-sensitive aminopeptidase
MRQHAYGNADTTDLWDAIEAETATMPAAVPAREIMDSWIFQGGFPLVSVELAPNGTSVTFSQERFAYSGGDPVDPQQWMIPLRYRWKPIGGQPITERVLLGDEQLEFELPQAAEWVIANAEGASFVRVAYPPESLDRLAEVALEQLSPVERYSMVDDAWAAVLADEMSAASFLHLLEMLTAEHDRSVWSRMISSFQALDRLLDDESQVEFQAVVHDALVPALAGLTLSPQPEDDDLARQLRGDLIRAMGTIANDHEIQEEAKRTLAEARRDPELVEASIVAAATDVVASIGDETDFTDFLHAFATADTPQEQLRFLYATADFTDPELHERVYAMVLDGDVRSQNAHIWLRRSMANPATGRQTWRFIRDHWDELVGLLASSAVVRMVETIVRLHEPADVEGAAAFFADHPVPQGEKTLAQILERQRILAALHEREAARFRSIVAG